MTQLGEGWRCEASLECKHPVSREEGGLVPPAHSPSRNDNKQIKIMSRACVCYICVQAPIPFIIDNKFVNFCNMHSSTYYKQYRETGRGGKCLL